MPRGPTGPDLLIGAYLLAGRAPYGRLRADLSEKPDRRHDALDHRNAAHVGSPNEARPGQVKVEGAKWADANNWHGGILFPVGILLFVALGYALNN